MLHKIRQDFPGGTSGKESTCQFRKHKRFRFNPWVGKIPWRKKATHSNIFARRNPWTEPDGLQSMGCKELDLPKHLTPQNKSEKGEYCMLSFTHRILKKIKNKKIKLTKTERKKVVARLWELGEIGRGW